MCWGGIWFLSFPGRRKAPLAGAMAMPQSETQLSPGVAPEAGALHAAFWGALSPFLLQEPAVPHAHPATRLLLQEDGLSSPRHHVLFSLR